LPDGFEVQVFTNVGVLARGDRHADGGADLGRGQQRARIGLGMRWRRDRRRTQRQRGGART
jgi:hypothetical protein